jgi:ABC-type xylose transport system permease subunit
MAKSRKKGKRKAKSKSLLNRIIELKNNHHTLFFIAVMLFIVTFSFAADDGIADAMAALCNDARSMLAIGVMLMVIMAAIVYAVGQILGAETRARASVWATAMVTGAVIGIVIYLIVPAIIGIMAPDLDVEEACGGAGGGGTGTGSQQSAMIEIEDPPGPGSIPKLPPGVIPK